ncbi:MAG: peptidoglycan-binding protein LysM [Gammaproteobacteria bacterium]|nr:peptidoglycan-binding protein LysM [Gammaproteobacteria bacterium]
MGLFDFVRNVGNKIFNRDEEAAEKIRQHIEVDNPGIKDMKVAFNDGVVSIAGDAASPAAMEKAVLMAGNIKGVGEVKADEVNVPETGSKAEYYVIKSGDTLSALAKEYYGNAMDYPRIFDANREVIKDPDKIFVGQKIRIPLD